MNTDFRLAISNCEKIAFSNAHRGECNGKNRSPLLYTIQPCIKVIDRVDFEVSQPRAFIGILRLQIYETRLN